ncbi:MAG: electron transfer flavoprotein subunit beta/FixA family protein [bacterium]|nr:electron transfer flavoprotein subunit beta/FixA family protein [bacterium]
MRILTVIKQVPDSNANIKVADGGGGIETTGLKLVLNPFDEYGVEQAVRLKEGRGDVEEVVALAVGGAKASEILRTALAMGADRGIHVSDPDVNPRDELAWARIAAAAIKQDDKAFDLILAGKQSIDNDAGEAGPALAELLDLPHVGAATILEIAEDGQSLTARRRIEGAEEVVVSALPALVTCEKGLCEPRYPSLPNLTQAKKKPVETLALSDLAGVEAATAAGTVASVGPPPPRPAWTGVEGEPEEVGKDLVLLPRAEAKVI